MSQITFDTPILKVKGLETKFDVVPVSASLEILIGSRDLAQIVQQLHYWGLQGYGEVIDGVRWFYKSIKEWIEEVFPTFTPWKLGKMMKQLSDRGIIRREKLFTKHQIQNGDRFWWQPKNQTYYYSLITSKLQELADNFQLSEQEAENLETSVSIKTQILSNEEIKDTKDFDCAKNNTKNTSIENNSRDLSHPHLPCGCEEKKDSYQDSQELSNRLLDNQEEIDSVDFSNPEPDTNNERVEQKINQNKSTDKDLAQPETEKLQKAERSSPKLKATSTKQKRRSAVLGVSPKSNFVKKRENKAPWQDEAEKSQFYRALIQALPIVANSHSPQGLAKTIIAQLKRGEEHTYWDDFKAGLPIGSSTKPEWEIEPGVPYPMFIEYLTEKIIRGNNTQTQEQARNEVFRILNQPRQASAFWGQFKRSVVNVSEQVERDRALGVSNPNTPVWTRERIEPSIEEAAAAGKLITAANGDVQNAITAAKVHQLESKDSPPVSYSSSLPVPPSPEDFWNDSDRPQPTMREMLAARKVKGFCKPMPKASQAEVAAEERKQQKPKTNIAKMSLVEINDYLTDPVLRAQLTPQLFHSDYELITDYLGQIIGVKPPEDATEGRSSSSGE